MSENTVKQTMIATVEHIGEAVKNKEDYFRLAEMPVASEDYVDKIYQYIGITDINYTHGCFYECKAQGTEPETYAWENVDVQEGGSSGDSRISEEVTKIGVRINDGFRPYISIDIAKTLGDFSDMSPADLAIVANAYYSGDITLADVQDAWSVGDSLSFTMPAMEAIGVGESHAEQTVSLKIVDFNHDELVTPQGEIVNAFITFGFELAEDGAMGGIIANGWTDSARRAWCNSVCKNAIPEALRNSIKTVVKTTDGYTDSNWTESGAQQNKYYSRTTNDDVFFPTIIEMTGRTATKGEIITGSTIAYFSGQGGTRYAGHALASFRSKSIVSSSTCYWSDYGSTRKGPHPYYEVASTTNACSGVAVDTASGLMPHFCI